MTTTREQRANEAARKIVGDYVVSMCGFPSSTVYDKMKGDGLVASIEKAILAEPAQCSELVDAAAGFLENKRSDTAVPFMRFKNAVEAVIGRRIS